MTFTLFFFPLFSTSSTLRLSCSLFALLLFGIVTASGSTPIEELDVVTESTSQYSVPFHEVEVDYEETTITSDLKAGQPLNTTTLECKCGRRKSVLGDVVIGLSRNEATQLVIGGNKTERGEFPWLGALVKLGFTENVAPKVICGTSLINDRFVVTAAHCIKGQRKERFMIAFNAHRISATNDVRQDPQVQLVKVKRFIHHPRFSIRTVDNDVGLIELDQPVDLVGGTVQPICLPKSKDDDFARMKAVTVGWGFTRVGGVNSPEPLKATVPIITNANCVKTAYGSKITLNMLCAGYEAGGVDACTNDSGGPLMVENESRSTLAGIVSWGHMCAVPKLPGVYTRVGNYVDWIQQHTAGSAWCTND